VTQRFGVQLPLRRMFAGPTLERVAQALAEEQTQGHHEETEEGAL
jgi:yersiniabactin nonribosomal peptide synthetase